ncbi:MAG: hypothetical protein D3920_00860 [Candidatus Electrothrix sp. AW2]|nr:hypothetical protein [Candidatus Electrothrix gigas]
MRYLIQSFITIFFVLASSPLVYAWTFDDSEQKAKIDGIQATLWVQNGLLTILIILVMALIVKGRR